MSDIAKECTRSRTFPALRRNSLNFSMHRKQGLLDTFNIERPSRSYRILERLEIDRRLTVADEIFTRDDIDLLIAGVQERALMFRYALHVDRLFPEWAVDCEYNRDGTEIKRLQYGGTTHRIAPDIVVHQRFEKNNLLVIEAKIDGNMAELEVDEKRLLGFHGDTRYLYRFSVMLEFLTRPKRVTHRFLADNLQKWKVQKVAPYLSGFVEADHDDPDALS